MIIDEERNKTQNFIERLSKSCEFKEENESLNDFDIINDNNPSIKHKHNN